MVKKWKVAIPQLSGDMERRVYIYLPSSYKRQPKKRYPVLYMFDGHNVFFDEDATYGKSWGMKEYMDSAKKQLIIVAVECNHQGNSRLEEYSPVNFDGFSVGKLRGRGRTYMNWLIKELKPYIDENYRTLPDRLHTGICGSSMGGLMALYAATVYNNVFSFAASLSPSLWVNPTKVMELITKSRIRKNTCIYMDYGSEEMDNHGESAEALVAVSHLLLKKDVHLTLRIVPGGTHCEASWEKQIPIFMECLGL